MSQRHETYWAIRKRGTSLYLPPNNRGAARGFSFSEPTDPQTAPPRLFTSDAAAKTALSMWVKGRQSRTLGDYGFLKEPGHTPEIAIAPAVERLRRDYEIVEITMVLPGSG